MKVNLETSIDNILYLEYMQQQQNKENLESNADKKKSKLSNNNGHILKSSITKYGNNNKNTYTNINNTKHKKIMSSKLNTNKEFIKNGKNLKKNGKKIDDISDYFSKNKTNNNSVLQSTKNTKYYKVVKKDGKNEKKNVNKKYELEDDSRDEIIENLNAGRTHKAKI